VSWFLTWSGGAEGGDKDRPIKEDEAGWCPYASPVSSVSE
jgi:hypothetical protein